MLAYKVRVFCNINETHFWCICDLSQAHLSLQPVTLYVVFLGFGGSFAPFFCVAPSNEVSKVALPGFKDAFFIFIAHIWLDIIGGFIERYWLQTNTVRQISGQS